MRCRRGIRGAGALGRRGAGRPSLYRRVSVRSASTRPAHVRSFAPAPLSPVDRPAAADSMLPQSCAALAVLVVVAAAVGAEAPAAAPAAAQQPGQVLLAPEGAPRQKRYVAALARNGDLPFSVRREWHKKLHPAVSAHRGLQAALAPAPNPLGIPGKRYVGALARGGQLPGKRADDEPEDPIDREMEQLLLEELEAMDELQAAEQQLQRLQEVEDKRSLASLARGGQLPGKRFNDFRDDDDEDMKRGISTLAKNGQLPAPLTPGDNRSEDAADEVAEQKRGGVSALARLGYLPPHKKDLDWLLASLQGQQQFAPAEEKRNIGSLARGFNLPPPGKRNLGALARGGGFSALRYAGSKKNDILDAAEAEKRSAASLMQHGLPLGKRFHPLTFGLEERFWHPPQRTGKRSDGEGDGLEENALEDAEDITKRYVAALLRQGRLPVGGPGGPSPFAAASFSDAGGRDDADGDQLDEEKRHLGALRRISREAAGAGAAGGRAKRQASDEFALPVFQPNDAPGDLDDALLQRVLMAGEDAPGAADKRFLGRIPQMSRSRPRSQQQQASVRRERPRSRNI
ncbi:hypothetical protein R5R35_009424 [Gryllus longicercus]|uniref:Neuropeptide-like 1 n=1 Tax=Gryllus longicercus TaxID=2509291 RepID=A0AAN9VVM9_9ORTH